MRNLEKKFKTWLRNKDIYFGKKNIDSRIK